MISMHKPRSSRIPAHQGNGRALGRACVTGGRKQRGVPKPRVRMAGQEPALRRGVLVRGRGTGAP